MRIDWQVVVMSIDTCFSDHFVAFKLCLVSVMQLLACGFFFILLIQPEKSLGMPDQWAQALGTAGGGCGDLLLVVGVPGNRNGE